MSMQLEARNIADHLSNAIAELELAHKDALEAEGDFDDDAATLGETLDILTEMRDDLRDEQGRPELSVVGNED